MAKQATKPEWKVVVNPPHEVTYIYRTSSKALAEVYMRGLQASNPGVARHAYILGPSLG
jgi:hypothetical protein